MGIYLHYSLVLPEALGEGFMGIVALVWAMDCFVWSGFAFNLPGTYATVMSRVTKFADIEHLPELAQLLSQPSISWSQALALG